MTQQDDAIASRLSRIEERLARIEDILLSTREEHEKSPTAHRNSATTRGSTI